MNGYYINLKYREDRNDHFINNIKRYRFFSNIKRFEGIHDTECGEIGCVKSHIDALKLCLQTDHEYYLILEDDFCIINEENLLNFFTHFNKIIDKEWDIITLTPSGDTVDTDNIMDFLRIKNTITTTGYIIRKDVIPVLIDTFINSLNLLVLTGDKVKYSMDIYWSNIQDEVKFYYYKHIFASQLIGFSDIRYMNVDIDHIYKGQTDYMYNILNKSLLKYINEPYNDMNNFNLAYHYEDINQTAAALSYYLRCAEFTKNKDLSYECLLRMSKCLDKQKNRSNKELACIKHAISILPNRLEAYYIISLYHSYRNNWLDAYMYACIGLENKDTKHNPLIKNIGYYNIYQLLFQKALSGYNKGKINESKQIYHYILNNYKVNNYYIDIINNNLTAYPDYNQNVTRYMKNKYNKLKYKFIGSKEINTNYSQIYQDMFVLSMYNGKHNGTYLEINSGNYMFDNNTYLLETDFNWKGVSLNSNNDDCSTFNNNRINRCFNVNALEYDYNELLDTYGDTVDYLHLDYGLPNITYDILLKIPLDNIKFGVITYRHDYYNDRTSAYRNKSREYLNTKGYKLIVRNISPNKDNNPYEDWWIHPDLIDKLIWGQFIYKDVEYIHGEEYMFKDPNIFKNISFEIDNDITQLKGYHNNESIQLKLFKNCNVCDCIRRGFKWGENHHIIIDKYLTKDSICIEAGSHIGAISIKLSKVCKTVYCFEPTINTFDLLKYNMEGNCDNNFKLFNKGLGEICKSKCNNYSQPSGGRVILGVGLTKKMHKEDSIIEVITIDSLNLDKLDYIRIDVEDYEQDIINGGINTINKYKPIIVLECYNTLNPYIGSDLEFVKKKYDILIQLGYNVEHISGSGQGAEFIFTYIQKNNMKLNILPEVKINKNIPTAIIIDNFYDNIDEVRNYALSLDYQNPENHGAVGFRCESGRKIYEGTKEFFEKILNKKIQSNSKVGGWDYSTNGCFQWCPKGTQVVYHCDSQMYAGIVYLSPDAPCNCGTSLLRHKKYRIRDNSIFSKSDWYESIENKEDKNLFIDKSPWEEVDNIGNIYNRLVLFESHNVHAVTDYFGDTINNSRLFQLFFFNIEDP